MSYRRLTLLCAAFAWITFAASGFAQRSQTSPRLITLEFKNQKLKPVLASIFKQAGVKYRLRIADGTPISGSFDKVPLSQVINAVLKTSMLRPIPTYRVVKGVHVIEQPESKRPAK